ncbi:SAM-dependent methyltransferase [Methylobacterium sp. OAE515]|uniref:class I SAM-dependent methyltransferase n=1 Tax=Methylobacterium sp. OAE515 TaxID=2817895 RepID=UPI00178901BA
MLRQFIAEGLLPEDTIQGAHILDFGGWNGSLALILLELGAGSVTVLDPDLLTPFIDKHMSKVPGLNTFKGTIQDFAEERRKKGATEPPFDLVVAFSVTEHVLDLPQALYVLRDMIKPGGFFFTSHDNYYQPSGAHDGFIVTYGTDGAGYYGPRCWETEAKCATSEEFRSQAAASGPWAWGEEDERSKTPEDCTACPFFKRARPWAHLLYAEEFCTVFKNRFFSTGRNGSGLNKITPFQLKQFTIEAGFAIEIFNRMSVPNEVPPELLSEPHWHNEQDLKTLCIQMRARKPLC